MVNDLEPALGDWKYLPALPDTHVYEDLGDITVDNQTFSVRVRDDGAILYDWVSGPNEGYGFSILGPTRERSTKEHVVEIREFLANIDPETGFLG